MKRVKLSELNHIEVPLLTTFFKREILEQARQHLINENYSFDNSTCTMYSNAGWISKLSNPSDYTPYTNLDDIMTWEFAPFIRDMASRITNNTLN